MAFLNRSSILTALAIAVLLLALPGAIRELVRTGDPYLLTEHFFRDLLARLSGPGRLRFIIQPAVAIALGARSGIKDALSGQAPFLWAVVSHRTERRQLLRNAVASTQNLIAIAILLDVISQWMIFRHVRPGAALLVGPALIAVPYILARGLANRIVQWRHPHTPPTDAS